MKTQEKQILNKEKKSTLKERMESSEPIKLKIVKKDEIDKKRTNK